MRFGQKPVPRALDIGARQRQVARCRAKRSRRCIGAVFVCAVLALTFEPVARAADIVPQDSVHISVRPPGATGAGTGCPTNGRAGGTACYEIVLDGSYSSGQVLTVLAQSGTAACLNLDGEEGRVAAQKARWGDNAGIGFDAWYLGSRGGHYSETWSWDFPPGAFLVCAYLGGRSVVASASQAVTVGRSGPQRSGGVIRLAPDDLVYLGRSGLACYVFPKVFPDDHELSTPPGLNCYLGRPGAPIDVGLGSAAMYARGASGSPIGVRSVRGGAEALLTFSSLACSTRLCTRARTVPVRTGTLLSVRGEDIACIYDAPSHWDRSGGAAIECYATSGNPQLRFPGRVDNVVGAARRTAYVKMSFAGQPSLYPPLPVKELFGVSGFFLDHRIVAGIAARPGRSELVYTQPVCDRYAVSCRNGVAR